MREARRGTVAAPMANKGRSDIAFLLIAERKLCRAFIRFLLRSFAL
jgi:hypothetical protein